MSSGKSPALGGADPHAPTAAGSSSSHSGIQEIPLAAIRSKRMPPPAGDDGIASIPGVSADQLERLQRRVSEDLLSPTPTLTSSHGQYSSFLSPTSPPRPPSTGPYAASYRNNSAVSLPAISMPVPEPASKGYFGESASEGKDEYSIRYVSLIFDHKDTD